MCTFTALRFYGNSLSRASRGPSTVRFRRPHPAKCQRTRLIVRMRTIALMRPPFARMVFRNATAGETPYAR